MSGNPMGDDDDDALSEICALKDALCDQQELLQKLYNELDAEREASASAASEALAVILRLQGEKAAVKMEAEHYKRLAEEKIWHAEESLAMVEDAVYQKEMEVAALDYLVQAYRYKLLRIGYVDHGFNGETSRMPCRGKTVEEMYVDSGKKIDSYWVKIRRLNEKVKEIAGGRSETRSPSLSLSSRVSRGSLYDPTTNEGSLCQPNKMMDGSGQAESSDCVAAADNSCSTSTHDVFEVPQVEGRCELMEKDEIKNFERENVVLPEAVKLCARDEPKWLNMMLQSSQVSDVECRLVVAPPETSTAQFHRMLSKVGLRSEIVEDDRPVKCSTTNRDELNLLNEISEKVNLLHDDIRSLKATKAFSTREEEEEEEEEPSLAMALLAEEMLSFWL
ncbi:uncharacterized protein LOC121746448 [Salvia splendens]|uniref:uncharacterized protein LOC121746448 n=1 Tax=Salvia splendens TaxID=180675 RepID=UPI001C26769B|nr:uncharacterized protein LOC121746448 [Salvia splendens]XP_041996220.1 uncharacterized protein LOC121746448 [Salvia splendens]